MSKKKDSRIYLMGFMGSGKTSLGEDLAKEMKLNFIDLDELIEDESGEELHNIFTKDEDQFRKIEAETLRNLTFSNTIFALGGGTPCFYDNIDFIKNSGISVYLKITPEELLNRLQHHRKIRPLLTGKDNSELKEYIDELLRNRSAIYEKADIVFEPQVEPISELISKIDKLVTSS